MPSGEMNHGSSTPPSSTSYDGLMYQEYATYNVNNTIISYTDISTAQSQPVIAIASNARDFDPFDATVANTESLRVEELIPEQLRGSSERFITLIKDYYTYLNTNGLPTYETNRIVAEHDIDEVSAKYLDGIQGEIAKNIPDSNVMDRVSLYKKIVQYYTLKGSEESITTFFRLFFDQIIEVSYPRERLFELSSGNWEKKNSEFTQSITVSVDTEDLGLQFNYTDFQLKDENDVVIGLSTIVRAEEEELYNTAPTIQSLVIDLDSKKNLVPEEDIWDSIIFDKPVRGYFYQGANYLEREKYVSLDGQSAYVDFGDIGNNEAIDLETEEHTFIIRAFPRFSKENTELQPLFSLAKDYQNLNSHELFFNKTTGKIGRSYSDLGEPRISYNADSNNLTFTNFIDETTVGLDSLTGDELDHMTAFLSPLGKKYNGTWVNSGITFNNQSLYIHETDPVYNQLTADDLRFYEFDDDQDSIDGPNNLRIGQPIYGEDQEDFSGVNAVSEDGTIIAIGSAKNDDAGNNAGSVRVFQLNEAATAWSQLGSDIDGDSAGDHLGSDLSLSADGTILAVGAPLNATGQKTTIDGVPYDDYIGKAKVYELSGSTWSQKGSDILGNQINSKLGASISTNGVGNRIALGSGANPNIDFDIGTEEGKSLLIQNDPIGTVSPLQPAHDAVTSFKHTASATSYVYIRESDLENDRPRYSGSLPNGTTFSISWSGSSWRKKVTMPAGGISEYNLHTLDTPYPWLKLNGEIISTFTEFVQTLSFDSDGTTVTIQGTGFNIGATRVKVSGISNQYNGIFDIDTITSTSITYSRTGPSISTTNVILPDFTIEHGIPENPIGEIDGGKTIGTRVPLRTEIEVAVYEYNTTQSDWEIVGTNIKESNCDPLSSSSVRLSDDGRTILVGTHIINDLGDNVLCVRAYYNAENTETWVQVGGDSTFLESEDKGEIPISLSNDGKTFAVGILGNRTGENPNGRVEIYSLNFNEEWIKVGQTIEGEFNGDACGSSVNLNTAGDIIAIGSPNNSVAGLNSGEVRVFQYSRTESIWKKVGASIRGFGPTSNGGKNVSINGTGTRVITGAPGNDGTFFQYIFGTGRNRGVVAAHQVAVDATIGEFSHFEKNPTNQGQSRWSLKAGDKTVYYTDWYENSTNPNPYDIGITWNKGSRPGDLSLPVLPHCEYTKYNNGHVFTLHNRGYLSILYKHNGVYTPWQNITIGDTATYDEERLWDILDFAVDGRDLILLDRPVNGNSRILMFKSDEYHRYNFVRSLSLNLPESHSGLADFAHLKFNNSQIIVGTHTFNNADIAQVIQVYSIGENGTFSSEDYINLPPVESTPPIANIEFNISENLALGKWSSTDSVSSFESINIPSTLSKDSGFIPNSQISTTGTGFDFDLNNSFSLSARFKVRDSYSGFNDILSIGNITLRVARNPLTLRNSLQVVSQEDGKIDYPVFLDKIDTNVVIDSNPLETFSDEYFNSIIKSNQWNNLTIEFITGELSVNSEKVITGLRYSLNGFKRSKTIDLITTDENPDGERSPIPGITTSSQIKLYKGNAFTHIAFYNKSLTHLEFEAIERNLSGNYSNTITTGMNTLLDGGKFELSETGTVIAKVSAHGINIWEKESRSSWKNYYNSIPYSTNGAQNYITHTGSRMYSFKFFGDDLLLASGGLNNAKQFVDQYRSLGTYNKEEHNSRPLLFYFKSQYASSKSAWKIQKTFSPSTVFSQRNDDDFKVGLNYGVNITVDKDNDAFAISLEPGSIDRVLKGPNSNTFTTSLDTTVLYDVYKKIGNNIIQSFPVIQPSEGLPASVSYSGSLSNGAVLKIENNQVPAYSAILSWPNLIHTTNVDEPMIEYVYRGEGEDVGFHKTNVVYNDDFVISTAPSEQIYLNTRTVKTNEFSLIAVRGKADRYNGYVDISHNGSDFERIIEGNTIRHLIISPQANFVLGRLRNDSQDAYLNGGITHSQYYTKALSDATMNQLEDYFRKNVKKFYRLIFTEVEGSSIGAAKMTSLPSADKYFSFSDLNGHAFNSFLYFNDPELQYPADEDDKQNTTIQVKVDYGLGGGVDEVIYWGDGRLNKLVDNVALRHQYTLEYLGEYFDKKGRLSANLRLQDSEFWQRFSYVIRSGLKVEDWESTFLNLVHPAGLKFFASVILLVIRDNHWYGPRYINFDPKTRQNENLLRIEDEYLAPFRTKQPLEDLRWLESLVAPSENGGYHLPMFQPGWLQGDIRTRRFMFEAGLWTKLARSVPGNNLASKYSVTYSDGDPTGDYDIRVQQVTGEALLVGDVVTQSNFISRFDIAVANNTDISGEYRITADGTSYTQTSGNGELTVAESSGNYTWTIKDTSNNTTIESSTAESTTQLTPWLADWSGATNAVTFTEGINQGVIAQLKEDGTEFTGLIRRVGDDTNVFADGVITATKTGVVTTVGNISAADSNRTEGSYTIANSNYSVGRLNSTGATYRPGVIGATFTVDIDASGAATIAIINGGKFYSANDTITIPDANLGGGGAADLTFDVATVTEATKATATILATQLRNQEETISVYGAEEQNQAYLLQDTSSTDINSEMFVRSVLMAFKYVIPVLKPEKVFTKRDYEQNLKFKDTDDISSYLPLTIKDALNNSDVFMNVGVVMKKINQLDTEGGLGFVLEQGTETILMLGSGSGTFRVGEDISQTIGSITVTGEVASVGTDSINITNQVASDGSNTLFAVTSNSDPSNITAIGRTDGTTASYPIAIVDETQKLLIDDHPGNWWNDQSNNDDVSAPVEFIITGFEPAGGNIVDQDIVFQNITNDEGDNITIEGLVVGHTGDGVGRTILIAWKGAINTDTSTTLPSRPEADTVFRTGTIFTIGVISTINNVSAADTSRVQGTYTIGDSDYSPSSGDSGTGATFSVDIDGTGAASITITNGGTGYYLNDTITIPDANLGEGGGADLTFDVATIGTDKQANIQINT